MYKSVFLSHFLRHLAQFTTHYPTARILCEMYFTKTPFKILEIRPETLAQILTYSNVRSGSNVLLVESCQGLLTGSVLERLGNNGKIVEVYPGSFPVKIILRQFNIDDDEIERHVCGFSLEKLGRLRKILGSDDRSQEPVVDQKEVKCDGLTDQEDSIRSSESQNEADIKSTEEASDFTKAKRQKEELRAFSLLRNKNMDSLIIASRFYPKTILLSLIEYLRPSCPFVVYCQFKEPLMECYVEIRDRNLAAGVCLSETWCRQIQVLTDRTHPDINMSGRSGYILRGIKVLSEDKSTETNTDDEEQCSKRQRTE